MDLEGNINARKAAEELFDMACEEADKQTRPQRFWRELHERIAEMDDCRPRKKKLVPMDDRECEKFEQRRLSFGKFKDTLIKDVDLDYLTWFADQPEQEIKHLIRRYLANGRVKREVNGL